MYNRSTKFVPGEIVLLLIAISPDDLSSKSRHNIQNPQTTDALLGNTQQLVSEVVGLHSIVGFEIALYSYIAMCWRWKKCWTACLQEWIPAW
jgi:hypothetical protein